MNQRHPSPSLSAAAEPASGPPLGVEAMHESFVGVVWRRSRYVVAVVISAAAMFFIAWRMIAPPPPMEGVSLVAWPGTGGVLGALLVLAGILLSVAISMLVIHPDAPHTGMFCAFLGLGYLAIRGGTVHMLLQNAQTQGKLADLHRLLAIECCYWAAIILAAEMLARQMYVGLLHNTTWLLRSPLRIEEAARFSHLSPLLASTLPNPTAEKKKTLLADLGALVLTAAAAVFFLAIFLRSEEKGQVLFAAAISFGLAAAIAAYAFPDATGWPYWMAVPLAAAAGYLWTTGSVRYFGHAGTPFARALPIDYIATGVPGAILGYHIVLRARIHHILEQLES